MEYYNFCQQYKDYFTTAEVKVANQIYFPVSFFWN